MAGAATYRIVEKREMTRVCETKTRRPKVFGSACTGV
jgi:hypothetical protein